MTKEKEFVEETIILDEKYRLYRYGQGETIMISKPKTLVIKESGNHEIVDAVGDVHTAPIGWIHLKQVLNSSKSEKQALNEQEDFNK